ncbi:MucBP domain-containing protein [Levilactobacillus fujinensis]|uniref:MucBP domain-containing protein n=1 Tax=Levilactobacillus fujinensis TaxID=2486024 RepID=A0ABW1TG56_9LACO|nr:MucBP domain-containing protein [Levilactobacillus fujinensis]
MGQVVGNKSWVYMGVTLASLSLGSLGLTVKAHADVQSEANSSTPNVTATTESSIAATGELEQDAKSVTNEQETDPTKTTPPVTENQKKASEPTADESQDTPDLAAIKAPEQTTNSQSEKAPVTAGTGPVKTEPSEEPQEADTPEVVKPVVAPTTNSLNPVASKQPGTSLVKTRISAEKVTNSTQLIQARKVALNRLAVPAAAITTDMSGTFGTSAWNIDADGVLHFGAGTFTDTMSNAKQNPWAAYADEIKSISFDNKVVASNNSAYLFAGLHNLVAIEHADRFDVSQATNFMRLFAQDTSLVKVDTSNWDTSKVTDMFGTFEGAKSLVTVDVSQWNTSQVVEMANMFNFAQSLTTVDVSHWDTSQVKSMSYMFNQTVGNPETQITDTGSLQALDVSHWNMSNIGTSPYGNGGDIAYMFAGQNKLKFLDVSHWDVSHNPTFSHTFAACSALETLDVSRWNTSRSGDMTATFLRNSALSQLDVSRWDVSRVQIMDYMFSGMTAVKELNFSRWQTNGKVFFHMMHLVSGDAALTSLDLSGFHMNENGQMYFVAYLLGTNLRSFTMGPQSALMGTYYGAINDDANLPEISTMKGFNPKLYTGKWQAVGTGTVDSPNGASYSYVQLRGMYKRSESADGSIVGPAETYVWQENNVVAITGEGTKVYDGQALSTADLANYKVEVYGKVVAPTNGWQAGDLMGTSVQPALRGTSADLRNAGTYGVTLSAAGHAKLVAANPNLADINVIDGTYTIMQAPATITVNGQQAVYDGQAHQATVTVTGEVNAEKLAYKLDTVPQTEVGTYLVTPILNEAAVNGNYDIKLEPGTLAITAATGHVSVHYVNESGQQIAADDDQSGEVGADYTLVAPTISGAVLVSTPTNVTGKYALTSTDATFVYHQFSPTNPDNWGQVSVRYLDERGTQIADDRTMVGEIGTTYQVPTGQLGYVLIQATPDVAGQYMATGTTITLVYHQLKNTTADHGVVIAHYIDEAGKTLTGDTLQSQSTGVDYHLTAPSIAGYVLTAQPINVAGKFNGTTQEVTFVYHQLATTSAKNGLIISHYVDDQGQAISPDTKQVGATGSAYTLTAPTVSGYTLQSAPTVTGIFSGTVVERTFVYQKTVKPVKPVDPVAPVEPVTPVVPEQPDNTGDVQKVPGTSDKLPSQPVIMAKQAKAAGRETTNRSKVVSPKVMGKGQASLTNVGEHKLSASVNAKSLPTTLPQTDEATSFATIWGMLLAGLTGLLGWLGWRRHQS